MPSAEEEDEEEEKATKDRLMYEFKATIPDGGSAA
jgi:hypothetical protein